MSLCEELLKRPKDGVAYAHCVLTLSLSKKISALVLEVACEINVK